MMRRRLRYADLNIGLVEIVSARALVITWAFFKPLIHPGTKPYRIVVASRPFIVSRITRMSDIGAMLWRGIRSGKELTEYQFLSIASGKSKEKRSHIRATSVSGLF